MCARTDARMRTYQHRPDSTCRPTRAARQPPRWRVRTRPKSAVGVHHQWHTEHTTSNKKKINPKKHRKKFCYLNINQFTTIQIISIVGVVCAQSVGCNSMYGTPKVLCFNTTLQYVQRKKKIVNFLDFLLFLYLKCKF